MLEQEPKMDPELRVIDVIKEGVKEVTSLLEEYDQINLKFGESEILDNPDKMEQLIEQQGKVQEQLDQSGAWDLDNKLDRAMDALRTPPEDRVD